MSAKIYKSATQADAGVAVSGTDTFYSDLIAGGPAGLDGFSLHLVWTGTPTGTFTLWASDRPDASLTDDTDWVQFTTGITFTNPAGSASKGLYEVGNARSLKYRVKYVNASGTGTLSAWAHAPGYR